MPTTWDGHYLDGRIAARQRATIRLMKTGLELTTESGRTAFWPYAEIRQAQGFYAGEQVRLERGGEIPEALLVRDPAFLSDLHRVAPEFGGRFHNPARRRLRVKLTLLAAAAAVGITAALYVWGIPAFADLVASRVPVAWEERLGEAVLAQLAPPERRCLDPARVRAIDDLVAALTRPLPAFPYTVRVVVVDQPAVNAFALPGGYIVVLRGLLERTRSAEELAGVLAHELQHILHRHPTRAVLQHASTGLLVAAVTGDVSGALAYGLEGARTLGLLRYSRRFEEEADREGTRMLVAAGIDPAGMVEFFESLRKEGREAPALLQYLSTHPSPAERIARLRGLVAQAPRPPSRLRVDAEWGELRRICPGAPSAPAPARGKKGSRGG